MALQRPWALVTGASSGLGADFAKQLAQKGWNLVLTARRRDRLENLAESLRRDSGVDVLVVDGDLAQLAFRDALVLAATQERQLQMVINNAGFGQQDPFLDGAYDRWQDVMTLNMTALVDLSWRLGRHMRDHGKPSHLVNIASIGAYQPVPTFAVYAATKSFVRDFSEAIGFELAASNVAVTCVCPGATKTEFMDAAGLKLNRVAQLGLQSSESCVREALDAALAGQRVIVTGWLNKIMTFMTRLVPRSLSARLSEQSMRPPG